MKKGNLLYIVIFIFLFTSQICKAQNQESKYPIKIGAKIGYSLGKLSAANSNIYTQDYKSVSGIDLGIFIAFPLTEHFSIQPEINFTHRGGKRTGIQPVTANELNDEFNQFLPYIGRPLITDENPLYANFESESEFTYLEIPALVKFSWGDDFRFYTEVGPYLGILLSAIQHTSGTSQFYFDSQATTAVFVPNPMGQQPPFIDLPEQTLDADTETKDDLHTVNYGGIIGIGAVKEIRERSEVFIDLRASYSFKSIQIKEVFGKSHIGGIIFSIGYTYKLQ